VSPNPLKRESTLDEGLIFHQGYQPPALPSTPNSRQVTALPKSPTTYRVFSFLETGRLHLTVNLSFPQLFRDIPRSQHDLYPNLPAPCLGGLKCTMARVYADVNQQMPRSYWDYDSVNITWGNLENYEVVRKIGMLNPSSRPRVRTTDSISTVQDEGNTRRSLKASMWSTTRSVSSKS
jgi:hypothetical protein